MDVSPPSTMVALSCGYTISSRWQPLLLELSHDSNLYQTICKNARWSEDTFHKVDWPAMQSCMSQFSRVQQIAYGKLLHGILNTNVQNNNTCLDVQMNNVNRVTKLSINPTRKLLATPNRSIIVPVNKPNTVINAPHAP